MRTVRKCAASALMIAMILSLTGCNDFYEMLFDAAICSLGAGNGADCTEWRLDVAADDFSRAHGACIYHKQCSDYCLRRQTFLELKAEVCGDQQVQFQQSLMPGQFQCHLDPRVQDALSEADNTVFGANDVCPVL